MASPHPTTATSGHVAATTAKVRLVRRLSRDSTAAIVTIGPRPSDVPTIEVKIGEDSEETLSRAIHAALRGLARRDQMPGAVTLYLPALAKTDRVLTPAQREHFQSILQRLRASQATGGVDVALVEP